MFLCLITSSLSAADDVGIRAPDGFEVSLYAGDDLAHDVFSMAIDSHGRVVVAGSGYVKTLHDDDYDGRADRATLFSKLPKSGAHGMTFDGDDLICTGDDAVWRIAPEGESRKLLAGLTHREHGANGLTRGPDGWIYLICGNDAEVSEKHIVGTSSPVRKPLCGAVIRFTPDGAKSEVVAHGFRNPYDLTFHPRGEMFTVDADGERDHHLPWYAPNRLFDIASGGHHGWILRGFTWSWNRPASYFDNVERCVEIGRGSPTGLTTYAHDRFPKRYRDGVFSCCWTLGRVYFFPLKPQGATFSGEMETFLETTGTVGFAPVDVAVGPEGEMFVAIGGRGTRGSIFRVRYTGASDAATSTLSDEVQRVLATPQPLEAWSRAKWFPIAQKLGREPFEKAASDAALPVASRIRAVEIATDVFNGLSDPTIEKLIKGEQSDVVARTAWSVARANDHETCSRVLTQLTHHASANVRRYAWEGLAARRPAEPTTIAADWLREGEERRVRAAKLAAIEGGWKGSGGEFALNALDGAWLAHLRGQGMPDHLTELVALLETAKNDPPRALEAVRLLMVKLGDIQAEPNREEAPAGYSFTEAGDKLLRDESVQVELRQLVPRLAVLFPTRDAELNRELSRLLAMLRHDDAALVARLAAQITTESSPVEDLHYLMCLSHLKGTRSETATKRIAAGFARLHEKMTTRRWYPSRNWPDRVGDTLASCIDHDANLSAALVARDDFHDPAQAFLTLRLPMMERATAVRKLIASAKEDDLEWTSELVQAAAGLPGEEALPALRIAWETVSLRDAVATKLLDAADPQDRERFVESLGSIQTNVVEKAAQTLAKGNASPSEAEVFAAMSALRQACSSPAGKPARRALTALLEHWSGERFEIEEKAENVVAAYKPWFDWYVKGSPVRAAKWNEVTGEDPAAWRKKMASAPWDAGDLTRGKLVFEKRSCGKCHAGTGPLGPSLVGAAGRLSRDDLFAAIVDPSREVAPPYQTTQIVTADGKSAHGIVVYESPDGTLITTGPDTTIRIAGEHITSMRKSRISLMPTGLLAGATPEELADLYAYLQSLKGGR